MANTEVEEMKVLDKILVFREAGAVRRSHTFPYIGEYNIAMHCYNCVSMLFVLYDVYPTPPHLIKAMLWHDTPERWSGDVPSPAKMSSPLLKKFLDDLEERVLRKIGIWACFETLTENEKQWLNGIDLLELLFWTQDQILLGNKNALDMRAKIFKIFLDTKVPHKFPEPIMNMVDTYIVKWRRLPECDEFLKE